MAEQLGTLEELPQDYRDAMTEAGVAPLWPMMRNVLPHGKPNPTTRPGYWNYENLRPLLHRAGELTPVEKAERRVLVLSDPGRGAGPVPAAKLQLRFSGARSPSPLPLRQPTLPAPHAMRRGQLVGPEAGRAAGQGE